MFNIGSGELLVLLLLGLLVLGPERLPKAMAQVGRYVAQMRKLSSGFQDEIKRAMDPQDAPFRPGEETIRPPVADEVRVVGADPEPDEDDAGGHTPIRLPEGDDEVAGAPFAPALGPGDQHEASDPAPPADGHSPGRDTAEVDAPEVDTPDEGVGTVTPLHGHDDGDARAAG